MPFLIFIWIGDFLPEWAKIALAINSQKSKCNPILLCNRSIGLIEGICPQIFIEDFYNRPQLLKKWYLTSSNDFRNGFWIKSSERFFILNQFLRTYGLTEAFHAEIDNLIFDLTGLNLRLNSMGSGLFCPRDNLKRGIASLIYINNLDALDVLQNLYENTRFDELNDMLILGKLLSRHHTLFLSLPTENFFSTDIEWATLNQANLGGIFDAAAIGQYLMGIEIRNSYLPTFNGFCNENSGYDLNKLRFSLSTNESSICAKNFLTNVSTKIYNLHIHSKNFYLIRNGKLPDIISRINKSSKTCIGWKPPLINRPFFIK